MAGALAEIRAGRIVVFPARRRFVRGAWADMTVHPLLVDGDALEESLRAALRPYIEELRQYPLYVSIDKDVLTADDAAVNWDSGLLRLPESLTVLTMFLAAAEGRLIGADVLGDWSPVQLGTRLNRLCERLDHPSPVVVDAREAAARNQRANEAFLSVL